MNEIAQILRAAADVLERNGGNVKEVVQMLQGPIRTQRNMKLSPGMKDKELRKWAKGKVIQHLYGYRNSE